MLEFLIRLLFGREIDRMDQYQRDLFNLPRPGAAKKGR